MTPNRQYKTFIKYTIRMFCDKKDLVYIKNGVFVNDLLKKIHDLLKKILTGDDHTMTVFQVAESEVRFELFLVCTPISLMNNTQQSTPSKRYYLTGRLQLARRVN